MLKAARRSHLQNLVATLHLLLARRIADLLVEVPFIDGCKDDLEHFAIGASLRLKPEDPGIRRPWLGVRTGIVDIQYESRGCICEWFAQDYDSRQMLVGLPNVHVFEMNDVA